MPSVTALALPRLPIGDPAFAVDPIPYIEAARRQHPWLATCDVGYVVHEYQAIHDLTYMDDRFRPSMDSITEIMGAKGTPWGQFMDELMLAKTGEEHARIRNSVAASFTPRNIDRYRQLMRDVVSRLLDEWAPKRAFDFAEFAASFPITVMFALPLSISGRDPRAFADATAFLPEREQTNRHMAFGRGKHMCLGQHLARAQLQEGVHLIAQRITRPRLAGQVTWRPFFGVWGIRTLPIEFEPG